MERHRKESQQRSRFGYALTVFLFLSLPAVAQLRGRVVHVHDGDTFTMMLADGSTRIIRLQGIDCPELQQPYGYQARQFTDGLIYNRVIDVDSITTDRYHRIIGRVYTPAADTLNMELLRHGMAWHYIRYDHNQWADALEAQARTAKLGLWSLPIAPWQWRRMAKHGE